MPRKASKPASSKSSKSSVVRNTVRRRGKPLATKRALMIDLLKRPQGARIADLMAATGWQAHSVRAALMGFRKREMAVVRTKEADGGTVWRQGQRPDATTQVEV